MLRTLITLWAIILYTLGFELYIYELTHRFWDEHYVKLFYSYLTLGMTSFYLIDRRKNFSGFYHRQLNTICIWCVIVNYIIIIFNRHGVIGNAKGMFYWFNGGLLAVTIAVFINGIRTKLFNDE